MSVVQILVEENVPLTKIDELPWCPRCGNQRATVPIEIGEVLYDLCVPCSVKSPDWVIPA